MKVCAILLLSVSYCLAIDSHKTGEEIEPRQARDVSDGHPGHIIEPRSNNNKQNHVRPPPIIDIPGIQDQIPPVKRGFGDGDVIIEPIEKRNIFSICDNCVAEVGFIKSLIPNRGVEFVGGALSRLCFGYQSCKDKVASLVADIEETSAEEACNYMMLCSKAGLFPFSTARFCHVCERVVDKILPDFNNQTLEHIERTLDNACNGDPKCLDAASKIVAELSELTPGYVCEKIHLCMTKEETILAKDRCDACHKKLEDVFSTDNLQTMENSIRSICNDVQMCSDKVTQAFDMFRSRKESIITDVCKIGMQC